MDLAQGRKRAQVAYIVHEISDYVGTLNVGEDHAGEFVLTIDGVLEEAGLNSYQQEGPSHRFATD